MAVTDPGPRLRPGRIACEALATDVRSAIPEDDERVADRRTGKIGPGRAG